MIRSHLKHRDACKHRFADFIVIEIIDQCVRKYPGGEFAAFHRRFGPGSASDDKHDDFIHSRNGESFGHHNDLFDQQIGSDEKSLRSKLWKAAETLQAFFYDLRLQIGIRIVPSAFRKNSVSFAPIGELHHWLWDFHQISSV